MIHLSNIQLVYSNSESSILDNVTIDVKSGEWVSLIGPSGSGKTSLLKLIAGLLLPTEGTVTINNTSINDLSSNRNDFLREHVSTVYQQFRLIPQFSVLDNVMLPLIPYKSRKDILPKAEKLIEEVGLSHRVKHLPEQLSGGEQQRVAFARALITEPKILLCDEPTGNLDVKNRDNILHLLSNIHKKGHTIVLATHDDVVANKGERIITLNEGKMYEGVRKHA